MAIYTSKKQQSFKGESPTSTSKNQQSFKRESEWKSPTSRIKNPPGGSQLRYPGGEIISPSLPDSYQDGRGLEKQCGNCYFNKKGYCSKFNAGIKETYTCGGWGEPSKNENLIILEKQAYGSKKVTDKVETEFSELTQNNKKDLSTFFSLYNSLFFDIPKNGTESHEDLMKRSRDYLNNYIDPKDVTIEALQDEIEHLNGTLLNNSMKGAAVSNNLNQFSSIGKITIPKVELTEPSGETEADRDAWKLDPSLMPIIGERVTPTPVGSDENNDGIDDSTQTLSAYGTVMLWAPNSGNTSYWLSKPNHWYYKPKYYGKPIYCFLRKLPYPNANNALKNLIVINLGAQNQRRYRTLKIFGSHDGPEFRIQKKYWTDRNTFPSGKHTGVAGYLTEPL